MPSIDIDVQCDDCGSYLDASVHGTTIVVDPCSHCKDREYERGYDDGKDVGDSEGYNRGHSDGYAEGYHQSTLDE